MTSSSSPGQAVAGFLLGVALQPVAWFIVLMFTKTHRVTLELMFYALHTFGMVQAIVILPAAILCTLLRKDDLAAGLLTCGTLLAFLNCLIWIAERGQLTLPPIY